MKPQAGITPWPDLMVNLRKTRQIELTDIHPQHVVCAWLGNSEDVAKKHYLKVTDGHMAAGCLVSACQKAGPKAGLSVTAMPSHAVSAKSQTLENKAYHVMSYHDMPAIGGQVGDEGLELLPFSAGSRSICLERDAESDAYLHEKVVGEQFKLFQPLLSTELKQSLIAELVASLVEG